MLKKIREKSISLSFILGMFIICSFQEKGSVYTCRNGQASFLSDAPLEIIKASSRSLAGAINLTDRSFSFLIPTKTFEGFNSSLQKTHFNEDYMETETYPNSTFKGKIIEEVDLSVPGTYKIRAKGKMYIHGVENDRIVRCDLIVGEKKIDVSANFTVFLADHDISIPSILNQKIAEEIKVEINFALTSSEK
ncbi:MAG: YceI family protein [Bacteroidetes bacterium]|nr:YceI family protein [Bacteroidota bacterium]